MSESVKLPGHIADKLIAHARDGKPEEVCGLVAAEQDGAIVDTLPVRNAADNKVITYHMDPHDQLKAFRALEHRNLELYGIYHSHPATEAYPSETDRGLAFDPFNDDPLYPGTIYFIVSLAGDDPVIRGFRLPDPDTVEEVPIEIAD